MGLRALSITLANSIIGVGILAMPFCFQQCGAVLAALMLLLSNLVSRLTCHFLLKSALLVRRRNIQFLALNVFGPTGKLMIEIGIIGFMLGTCIAYLVVVGDLGPQIVAKMFNINQSDWLRTSIMILISLVCVLPLGLLRNVDSLSNVSAATIGFYLCLIIKIVAEATSRLFSKDWWSKIELWRPEGVLQCVPIFAMALSCQTQLFEVFETTPTLSLEKMNMVSKNALNLCSIVYLLVGLFGYIAFSTQTISGNILVSLSSTMASDVIKLGFVMSLAFSFPLVIFPCRASIYSLLYRRGQASSAEMISYAIPTSAFRVITIAIICVSLLISLILPNVEVVLGLVGATIGVAVCFVFPALCFLTLTNKNTNERVLAQFTVFFGLMIVVLGTFANLQAAEDKLEHPDYRHLTPEKIDKIVDDFMQKREYEYNLKNGLIDLPPKIEDVKQSNDLKHSDVQPPVPIAPIPQSNEINKVNKVLNYVQEHKLLLETKKEPFVFNKEVDINKFEGAGDKEVAKVVEKDPVEKKAELELKNEQAEAIADKKEELLKQQQLVEVIKQHRDEQKELIKEQKEILGEIKKTKQEIEDAKVKDEKKQDKPALTGNADTLNVIKTDVEAKKLEKLEQNVQHQEPIAQNVEPIAQEEEPIAQNEESIPQNNAPDLKANDILSKVPIALAMNNNVNEKPRDKIKEQLHLNNLETGNLREKRDTEIEEEEVCEKKDRMLVDEEKNKIPELNNIINLGDKIQNTQNFQSRSLKEFRKDLKTSEDMKYPT